MSPTVIRNKVSYISKAQQQVYKVVQPFSVRFKRTQKEVALYALQEKSEPRAGDS